MTKLAAMITLTVSRLLHQGVTASAARPHLLCFQLILQVHLFLVQLCLL